MNYVIVGLGNPGGEYESTRHNAGRMAVEYFGKKKGVTEWREDKKAVAQVAKTDGVTLVLPDTYMNKSGSAVVNYVKSVKAAEKLVVVYDDMDLPLGKVKLSFDRGSGGHKGIESIARAVKTKAFVRIRVGVSPTTPSGKLKKPSGDKEVLAFILAKFKPAEIDELKKVFKGVDEALTIILDEGHLKAMNVVNSA
jgi:PTH1 family peptidyl-tRNA hydrolase